MASPTGSEPANDTLVLSNVCLPNHPLSSPASHCPRLLPEPGEGPDSCPPGRGCSDRMQAQDVSSRCHFLAKREGGHARELQVRPCGATGCLLYLQHSVAHLIFSVTELQSAGPAVLTWYNLNCITRCALHRPPSCSLGSPSPRKHHCTPLFLAVLSASFCTVYST